MTDPPPDLFLSDDIIEFSDTPANSGKKKLSDWEFSRGRLCVQFGKPRVARVTVYIAVQKAVAEV